MFRLNIKPLSVNEAFQGKRFRTPLYKKFRSTLLVLLKALKPKKPPEGKYLFAHYRWGVSNFRTDVDNPTKSAQDVLFDHWKLGDDKVEFMILEKVKVKKGEEHISFHVDTKEELIPYLEKLLETLKNA